jgi:hypothetical protein
LDKKLHHHHHHHHHSFVDGLEKLSHLIQKKGVQKQEKTLGDMT